MTHRLLLNKTHNQTINMDKSYQHIIDEMSFTKNIIGFELRYNCSDPQLGYRIVFTEIDDMDSFDTPFMEIARPSVFYLNELPIDKNLEQLFAYFVNSAYKLEKESLETMEPVALYQEIFDLVSSGRNKIESSELNLSDLFGLVQGFITLLVSTNILDDEENGIGRVTHKISTIH